MTDRHMRILRHMASQSQHKLDHHNTLKPAGEASTGRRDYLKRAAKRTRGQVTAAEERREAAPVRKGQP